MTDEIDQPAESAPEGDTSVQKIQARARLREFLTETQAQMPDVPEDEVERDIEEAIRAVRGQP